MKHRKPAVPITSPDFVYTSSLNTDVAATFARIRAQQQEHAARERAGIKPAATVAQIKRRSA